MSELRNLRLAGNIPVKELVAFIQERHPKYDKTLQSKCENSEAYGITLLPETMQALHDKWGGVASKPKKRPSENERKPVGRISARLELARYALLQQRIKADGYPSMQSWLANMVDAYLDGKGGVENGHP